MGRSGVRTAVFLDRDGTINREVNYLADPGQLELLPGAKEALARMASRHPLVVVTNQAGIARGYLDEPRLQEIHARLAELLQPVPLAGIYYCPHHPEAGAPPYRQRCACRKPRPGMLLRAAEELGIDLAGSVIVGDKLSDLEAGREVGCRTLLVLTGYGQRELASLDKGAWRPDHVVADLSEAAARIAELPIEGVS